MKTTRDLLNMLEGRKKTLLVLDFDGTLCETAPTPDEARLTPQRRNILRELAAGRWRLAIISGRPLADLKQRVAIKGIIYGGNFGLEMEAPRWNFIYPKALTFQSRLRMLSQSLSRLFQDIPGVLIEEKKWGVGLHNRNVPHQYLEKLRRRWMRFQSRGGLFGLRSIRGERTWEILPDIPWGKGAATLFLWRRLNKPHLLVIGDTHVDEDMFKIAKGRGIAIRVGRNHRSLAAYRLKDVAEVYRFLSQLTDSPLRAPRR